MSSHYDPHHHLPSSTELTMENKKVPHLQHPILVTGTFIYIIYIQYFKLKNISGFLT